MKLIPAGFTLVELMATLTILTAVMALGLPAMASLRRQAQAITAFNLLTTSLANARITAVSKNRAVSVCPSRDGRSCRTDLNWDAGWIIYLDAARKKQPSRAEDVLQYVHAPTGISIRSTLGRPLVRYLPDGRSSGSNVSLGLCSKPEKQLVGHVVVNNAGRVRSQRPPAPTICPYAL